MREAVDHVGLQWGEDAHEAEAEGDEGDDGDDPVDFVVASPTVTRSASAMVFSMWAGGSQGYTYMKKETGIIRPKNTHMGRRISGS